MNICKKCEKYTKSGICLYFRLKIFDIFDECDHLVFSIPKKQEEPKLQTLKIPKNKIKINIINKNGEFEYIPHYCKHCQQLIPLEKENIQRYINRGFPEYIQGHHLYINNPMFKPEVIEKIHEVRKAIFCYLPHFCKCPECKGKNIQIKLDEKAFRRYENYGYPIYIQGHQMNGRERLDSRKMMLENNPMHNTEIVEKVRILNSHPRPDLQGRKRPDMVKLMKENNPMWNPKNVAKYLLSRYGKEISEQEVIENPKITTIIINIEAEIKSPEITIKPVLSFDDQLKIALNRIAELRKTRKIENILSEIKLSNDEEENTEYANRINILVTKFADPDEKPKKYLKPLWKINPRKT